MTKLIKNMKDIHKHLNNLEKNLNKLERIDEKESKKSKDDIGLGNERILAKDMPKYSNSPNPEYRDLPTGQVVDLSLRRNLNTGGQPVKVFEELSYENLMNEYRGKTKIKENSKETDAQKLSRMKEDLKILNKRIDSMIKKTGKGSDQLEVEAGALEREISKLEKRMKKESHNLSKKYYILYYNNITNNNNNKYYIEEVSVSNNGFMLTQDINEAVLFDSEQEAKKAVDFLYQNKNERNDIKLEIKEKINEKADLDRKIKFLENRIQEQLLNEGKPHNRVRYIYTRDYDDPIQKFKYNKGDKFIVDYLQHNPPNFIDRVNELIERGIVREHDEKRDGGFFESKGRDSYYPDPDDKGSHNLYLKSRDKIDTTMPEEFISDRRTERKRGQCNLCKTSLGRTERELGFCDECNGWLNRDTNNNDNILPESLETDVYDRSIGDFDKFIGDGDRIESRGEELSSNSVYVYLFKIYINESVIDYDWILSNNESNARMKIEERYEDDNYEYDLVEEYSNLELSVDSMLLSDINNNISNNTFLRDVRLISTRVLNYS